MRKLFVLHFQLALHGSLLQQQECLLGKAVMQDRAADIISPGLQSNE